MLLTLLVRTLHNPNHYIILLHSPQVVHAEYLTQHPLHLPLLSHSILLLAPPLSEQHEVIKINRLHSVLEFIASCAVNQLERKIIAR